MGRRATSGRGLTFLQPDSACYDNNKLRKESRDFFICKNLSDARQEAAFLRWLCGQKDCGGRRAWGEE